MTLTDKKRQELLELYGSEATKAAEKVGVDFALSHDVTAATAYQIDRVSQRAWCDGQALAFCFAVDLIDRLTDKYRAADLIHAMRELRAELYRLHRLWVKKD